MSETVETEVQQPPASIDERIDAAIQNLMNGDAQLRRGSYSPPTIPVQEVKIYPNYVEVELKGIKKAISMMDFKQMIDQQLQVESSLSMMALPYHTFLFAKSNTTLQLACYYPERKLDLKYGDRGAAAKTYKGCQMPNVVICHTLKHDNGHWTVEHHNTRYWATSKKVTELPEDRMVQAPNRREGIWCMPFPNFYEDGRMCYGGNTMPVRFAQNLRGLDYYYQVISDSPFNSDLGLRNVNHDKYANGISEWFKYLQTLDAFDYAAMR